MKYPDRPAEHIEKVATIKQAEGCYLHAYRAKSKQEDAFGSVNAANPKYSFKLRSTGEKSWLLKHAYMAGEYPATAGPTAKDLVEQEVLVPVSLPYASLAALVKRPTFRATRVRQREGGLIEVEFTNPHPVSKERLDPVQGGTVVLDPNHSWCVRSCFVDSEDWIRKQIIAWVVTYREPMGKFPVPLRLEQDYRPPPGVKQATLQEMTEYDLKEARDLPPVEEFTLSAFGMPEPVGVTWKRPIPSYVWLIAGAALCGALAVLFRYLAKPRADAPRAEVGG